MTGGAQARLRPSLSSPDFLSFVYLQQKQSVLTGVKTKPF